MPRLAHVDPASDSGPGADFLNGPLKSKQINIFKGLATNAPVLKAFVEFSGAVKGAGSLTPAEHETVALVVGEHNDCDYCVAAHTAIAQGVGISEDAAANIRGGRASEPKHQALVDFTKAIMTERGFVSDAHLDAFRAAGYDDAAVIEVIAAVSVNTFTNLFNHMNQTEVDFPQPAAVS